jgi:Outer membrane protein
MQADAQAKIIGAPLLPEVDFAGFAQRVRPPGGPERNVFQAALNASYEIDFWGKNRAASRAAQETAVASRFNKEVVVLSTIAAVGNSYFLVLTAQDRLRIARQNFEAANRVLTLIKQRFDAGTASQLDVAQQQSLVDQVRANHPAVRPGSAPEHRHSRRADRPAAGPGRGKGGSLYRLSIPRVTPGCRRNCCSSAPTSAPAEANLASADASVESARAAFFPSISLTGQGGYQSNVLKLLFTPQNAFYNLAVNVTQPLLDGFLLEGQLELTQGRQFELLKTYCHHPRRLPRRGACAHRHRRRGRARASAAARRQQLARSFNLAETRLREGTVDLVTVLQTQQTLFTAENNLVLARLRACRRS